MLFYIAPTTDHRENPDKILSRCLPPCAPIAVIRVQTTLAALIRAGMFSRCHTASKMWGHMVKAFGMLVLTGGPHVIVKKAVEPVTPTLGTSPRMARYKA